MSVTPQTNASLARIAEIIRANDDFVLCGHVSPDGDCLGSQLALWHALSALGKRASCVLVRDEPLDASLAFLPGIDRMVPARSCEGPCRVFIGLDVPIRERIGDAAELLDTSDVSITIDHHAADARMCEYAYVDPDSASTSILVWELVKLLVENPPFESALCAYVGLVTDTGGFRFQNSDARAFEAASDLVGKGVDPAFVATRVFQSRSIASLRLESIAVGRMRILGAGEGVLSWIERADFDRFGATKADAEPIVNCIRSLAGVRVACVLREQEGGGVRGSLRSKDDTDVSVLARELGGGGHRAAAGITVDLPLGEAVELVSGKICDLLASTGG